MNLISLNEAVTQLNGSIEDLGLTYHTMLSWVKKKKFGLGEASAKVGWGWVIDSDKMPAVIEQVRASRDKK